MITFEFIEHLYNIPNKSLLLRYKDVTIIGAYVGKYYIILNTAIHTKKHVTIRHIVDTLIRFNNRSKLPIIIHYKYRYMSFSSVTLKNNYIKLL